MIEKLFLTEQQYEFLCKCIVIGTGVGIFIGMFFDKVIFMFSLGGVLSILFWGGVIIVKKIKSFYKK